MKLKFLVLDCGSTGCRLHILNKDNYFYTSEVGSKLSPIQEIYSNKRKKLVFISKLKKEIQKYGSENTKLYVGMTAGVRNLKTEEKKKILESVRNIFEASKIKLIEDIRIMSSKRESKLERLSVNYVINYCKKQYNINSKKIYGHIGMGGASIQISINKDNLCNNKSNILIPISFTNKDCIKLIDNYFDKNKFKEIDGIFYGIESIYYIILLNLGKSYLGKPLKCSYLLKNLKLNDKDKDSINFKTKYIFIKLLQNIFSKRSIILTLPHSLCSTNDECVWALGYYLDKMKFLC